MMNNDNDKFLLRFEIFVRKQGEDLGVLPSEVCVFLRFSGPV